MPYHMNVLSLVTADIVYQMRHEYVPRIQMMIAERKRMTTLLDSGYIDTFRYFYPELTDAYSWWSYRFHAREKNAGWRIDYFIVSEDLKARLQGASIHSEIYGSDHCPVELVLS